MGSLANQQIKRYQLIGALGLLIASIFSVGYHHFDEHFQILEFAGLKLGLTEVSDLAWEYQYQIRPSLQPAIAVLAHRFLGLFGLEDPFLISTFLRLISAGLSFLSITLLYRAFKDKISDPRLQKWLLILSYTLWFIFYIGVRFSSENWSGICFITGFSIYFLLKKRHLSTFLGIGALFGLSFLFRFQAALMVLGFSLWLLIINRERFKNLLSLFMGFALIFLLGMLVDKWFYGEWTVSSWNYFTQNIIEDKVSGFGVRPWYWYLTKSLESGVPPISLFFVMAFFVLLFFKPKSPVIWAMLPFLLVHSIIGHKEFRFLFPLYLFMPLVMIQGVEVIQERYLPHFSKNRFWDGFMKLLIVVNTVLILIVVFKPADNQIALYKTLYQNYEKPTELFYIEKNPYHRVLEVKYYKRENLTIKQIDSIDQIPEGERHLLVIDKRLKAKDDRIGNLVYSTFPNWLLKYNFNNWQERTFSWYVYEVN